MSWFSFGWFFVEVVGELVQGLVFAIDLHFDLALFGVQHHRLLAEPTDHVERTLGDTTQRQLLCVLSETTLDDRT